MLPLGLVNLVAVAVLAEFGRPDIAGVNRWLCIAAMWAFAIAVWVVAGLSAPLATDNRPRADLMDSRRAFSP